MYGKLVRVLYDLHMIFEALFCLALPIGLAVGGSYLLVTYAGVGEWIYAVLILLGVPMGLWAMVRFILRTAAQIRALEESRRKAQRSQRDAASDVSHTQRDA